MRRTLWVLLAFCIAVGPASAIPVLQIYITGADYDKDTETWMVQQGTFDVWVIGAVGQYGPIYEAQLTMAYHSRESGQVQLTPGSAEGWIESFPDPSIPSSPVLREEYGAVGTVPYLLDGTPLPNHGVYGPGVAFYQWALGDFSETDSRVGDFAPGMDPSAWDQWGQVNLYHMQVLGYSEVHFDAFNHYAANQNGEKRRDIFVPFSHDGGGVPEPTTLLLVGSGLAGCFLLGLRRRGR